MNHIALSATLFVIAHFVANVLHGWSHVQSHVPLELWQQAFVLLVVFLLPVIAGILYWSPWRQSGAALLAASCLAATVFGIYFHYIAETVDHVSHRHDDPHGTFFIVTAGVLIPMGVLGVGLGIWNGISFRKVSR